MFPTFPTRIRYSRDIPPPPCRPAANLLYHSGAAERRARYARRKLIFIRLIINPRNNIRLRYHGYTLITIISETGAPIMYVKYVCTRRAMPLECEPRSSINPCQPVPSYLYHPMSPM